ncbi:HAD hydrolase family protein [Xanthomonadaceae bacterium JHOS43]|nr:HAD hydrolase family protein [Xanthomonadaceae bacterium JHOS43]MCX7563614.1 HAD hydrolase family protein [Xanthomonadaceae bacterium XH05]
MSYLADVPQEIRARASRVRLVALDVDGTLTDGRLRLASDGTEIKAFSALDGQGLKLLRDVGIEVALITARRSQVVAQRAAELGISHVYQGSHDKRASLRALCQILALQTDEVAYMGDDLPDLPALILVGLAVAPANAHPWLLPYVHWTTHACGGAGAARELCDLILDAQERVAGILRQYADT